jgi:acetyl-CoA acetyltransferase
MKNAYIIDAIRTPFGRYAGGLAPVRAEEAP